MLCLLIIRHDDAFAPTPALVEQIHAWDDEMTARGVRIGGRPLRPPGDGATVRVRDGSPLVTEGPFAAEEQVAAYELIDCAGLDEATAVASTHPMALAGAIEVRPVWEELTAPGDAAAGASR